MNTLMKETPDTHITSPHLILHYTELLQLATVLKDSECLNLRKFVHQSLLYWHYILIQSTAKCVEKSLSDMQYPFQDGSHLVSEAQIASFTLAFTQLVLLYKTRPPVNAENFDGDGIDIKSLDDNIENSGEKSEQMVTAFNHVPKSSADEFCISEEAIMSDFEPLIMPLEYIFKPLEVRFMYHFSGKKKTNELAHPEWCLSKVLNWINVHESFFDDHLQPVLNRHELSHIKVKVSCVFILDLHLVSIDCFLPKTEVDLYYWDFEIFYLKFNLKLLCVYNRMILIGTFANHESMMYCFANHESVMYLNGLEC